MPYTHCEDNIDYLCSDLWLGFYHDQGLTPRRPLNDENKLLKRIEKLEEENSRLLALLLKHLEQENKELKEKAKEKKRVLDKF